MQKNQLSDTTIGEIVARDIRTADVFLSLGIDFCCGGGQTIAAAADRIGIPESSIWEMLQGALTTEGSARFDELTASELITYIKFNHHEFIRKHAASLVLLAQKVAAHHQAVHPELNALSHRLQQFFQGLEEHLHEEETVLFPAIVALAAGADPAPETIDELTGINEDHKAAGDDLRYFRELTHNYEIPDDACTSYKYLMGKLAELEKDLLIHIHLENNILFPKALRYLAPLNPDTYATCTH